MKNVLSFGDEREFNLLPAPKHTRLNHHKYAAGNTPGVLKLSAIYGANGAGKSNLITAIMYLKELVTAGTIPLGLPYDYFRLDRQAENSPQLLGAEYFSGGKTWFYGVELKAGKVITEELFQTSAGKTGETLIFSRETNSVGKTSVVFFKGFEDDPENRTLKAVIEKTLARADQPLFKLLSDLDNEALKPIQVAHNWFKHQLRVIVPSAKPVRLAYKLEKEPQLYAFANELMKSFKTGVVGVKPEKKTLEAFAGNNQELIEKISTLVRESKEKIIPVFSNQGEEAVAHLENNKIFVTRLSFIHQATDKTPVTFYLDNESDGTVRLLDYIPAFWEIFHYPVTYVIDEIERSLHPLIIKELIRKFSNDKSTKGQLIFTTHESNLLDQNVFRQDEIWFAEKDPKGCTDLYPLSDFKEHHTKDIEKGYLNGRYGGVPFLGNLKDLHWENHEVAS
jgi:AAA15 family ATPase/GTPase